MAPDSDTGPVLFAGYPDNFLQTYQAGFGPAQAIIAQCTR